MEILIIQKEALEDMAAKFCRFTERMLLVFPTGELCGSCSTKGVLFFLLQLTYVYSPCTFKRI